MAITDSSKVDLLYKKLFGVAKTDTSTNKGASNESIASPALNRGDKIWLGAGDIPGTPPGSNTSAVQVYQTTTAVQCVADTTTVPVSSVYPTWKTSLTDWIPPEFGSNYFVKVYADNTGAANPATTGTQIFDSGIAGVGEWFFDYQSGVLNFIGGTIPAALTSSKVIYIAGYRYIGLIGVSNISVSGNTADEFARSTANTAVNDAASASLYANTGITLAQAAYDQGNSTATVANTAVNNANSAGIYANTGITLAQSAYDQSNVANTIANTAVQRAGDTMTGALSIQDSTSSNSITTGALIVLGGAGVSGNLYANTIWSENYTGTLDGGTF